MGYDERKFAGHSFRARAASTAAAMGIEDSLIKMMGMWENSPYLYISRHITATIHYIAYVYGYVGICYSDNEGILSLKF